MIDFFYYLFLLSMGNVGSAERITALAMNNALSHATLISGPAGVGKYEFWEKLSQKLLCTDILLPPDTVKVNILYQEGITTDTDLVSSTFDQSHRKKKKTKSNTIGIDDIESFTKHLFDTTDSQYKIVIIKNIERMTIEASNTFLKILEEPPAKTLFFLTTSQEADILPTVFSRVQKEYFYALSDDQIEKEISESTDENTKKWLVKMAKGRREVLKKMMENEKYFEQKKEEWSFFENFSKKLMSEKMKWAEEISKKSTDEIVSILDIITEVYQYILQNALYNTASNISSIHSFIALTTQSKKDIVANGNKRLILESLVLHWSV